MTLLAIAGLITVSGFVPSCAETSASGDLQQSIIATVDAVKPALVRIHVVSEDYEDGRAVKHEVFGSGVIITSDGCVITNHHVAGHARQMSCTLADKTEVDAILIGSDALTDIAVIKLTPEKPRDFPAAKFGDSSKLKVGDRVLAMGSPLAFSQSVTMGIVSNTELVMPDMFASDFTLDGEDVGSVVRWIAHDAAIHPGNSGGPLVDMRGEIIGVNEIELGLGGAIPGNLAREVAQQIIDHGKVSRSWLGISAQPLLKSSATREGVLVSSVLDGSPSAKAGIRPGDILTRLDGKPCSGRFKEDMPVFNQLVLSLAPGKEIEAVVIRGGKEVPVKVTPVDKTDSVAKEQEFREWGICASDITFLCAKEMSRQGTTGVLVTSTRQGGPADDAKPKIMEDDVIVSVAGKPVKDADGLRKITEQITAGKHEPVPTMVGYERNVEHFVTVVKLGTQELDDPGLEVRKAWLPVSVQVLTADIANAMGISDRKGFRVTHVYPGTTAEKAKLQVGDIILALDATPFDVSEPEDTEVLDNTVRQYKVGSTAQLTVLRGGKEQKTQVQLPESPKLAREMRKYKDEQLDLAVRDICFFDRVERQWPQTQTGALVTDVGEGGWASVGHLAVGDVITAVNGKAVSDVAAYEAEMKMLVSQKPKTLVFTVKDGIRSLYLELIPTWPNG
jgi:serine protease Do